MSNTATMVGLGEVLWDVFPAGPRFGGAPANFACSAKGLGGEKADVWMVSSVGNDELGKRALEALRGHDVNISCVVSQQKQTGKVDIELNPDGSARYEFAADTAWDNLGWSSQLEQLANRLDVVCFGTLGQRGELSRATIQRFVAATSDSSLRIFDVNLRTPFVNNEVILESLQLANVLKLNGEELPYVADLCGLAGADIKVMQQLADRFRLRLVALTRGAEGAVLLQDERVSEQSGIETEVVDTVGAGDAFTASLALGLLEGHDLDRINRVATSVAAFVCSQSGATPRIPRELMNAPGSIKSREVK